MAVLERARSSNHRMLRSAQRRFGPAIRKAHRRIDDPEVGAARRLACALAADRVDVLILGDSLWIYKGEHDLDRRPLQLVVADKVAEPDVRFLTLSGGGYPPALMDAFLHVVRLYDARPTLVVPLCVRLRSLAWSEHPAYTYRAAIRHIRGSTTAPEARRLWNLGTPTTPSEMAAFNELELDTFLGRRRVGELREPLKDPEGHGLTPEDRERLLYLFHHGEPLVGDSHAMEEVRTLARTIRELNLPVVVYETPAPVVRGTELYGQQFTDLLEHNYRSMRAAFVDGYGSDPGIVRTGLSFSSHEFIDPADATEHLNDRGRARIATILADRIRETHPRSRT